MDIKETLRLHKLWVEGHPEGSRADLEGADLKSSNLKGANLEGANLKGVDLKGANLYGANLYGANLYGANLKGANLYGAYLYGAYLYGANLEGVDLKGAYLKGANLYGANLYGANLEGVDLKGAYLKGAYLYGAYLKGAYLEGAKLPNFLIAPEEGSFTAWKKTTKGVIKIIVPEDAKRTNSLIGRKCRASKIVVVDGEGCGGTGTHYRGITYDKGATIECPDYDGDIRVECTKGIHFFMTKKEAQEW